MQMPSPGRSGVQGHVRSGFEVVREAFDTNFARRHELGGACCAYYQGEKVVDLWVVSAIKLLASPGSRTRW